jgi:hypothetical protein
MANYKNTKFASLTLSCFCFSLNAFGMENGVLAHAALEEKADFHSGKAHTAPPAQQVMPTREELYERLQVKARVLISELPKAKPALERIERELVEKIQSIKATNFRRASELAGLASSVKMLSGTVHNTIVMAARDCSHDDKVLGLVAMTIIGSGALKDQLRQFSSILEGKEDTRDIDCSALMEVSDKIHGITKDIVDPFEGM